MQAEDNALAAAAASGDQAAFTVLVERYRAYAYTIAWKIALNEDDALDIAQNAFMRVVERIGQFDGRGPFRAWLATIVSREAMTFLRRRGNRETATEPEILAEVVDARVAANSPDPREAADVAQRRRMVEAAISQLPPQQRAILTLRIKEDMGPKEIAERLGLPAQQVRSQIHRAIARVREAIARTGAKTGS